jgi:ABC-type cobalamin/Fe3+-siderophores transport system ATPase subunit
MALRAFKVENEKAIRLAACEAVPPVMIVAGPNGVGKSTLLYALHRRTGTEIDSDTQIIYQPPHRAIRRQQIQRRWLSGGGITRRISEIFSNESVEALEGLSIPFPRRAPDNVDEAGSTLKYTLGRLENRRQAVLAALVDQRSAEGRDVKTEDLLDIYEPIRRLTSRLLPHLCFERIDFSDESDIRCVFTRTDLVGEDELDLDDLSSGEKSIFILFLPLIEADIAAGLNRLDPTFQADTGNPPQDQVILIDETEQHLHPELQARLLGYLREEAARSGAQFLVTTHSPTLVDQAFDDELYLLNFPSGPGQNQLRRIASTPERLDALRALAGSTFVVTTGRTIICIEGAADTAGGASDLRLLETLHPAATRYTFVPVGGKGNVIRVVEGLRGELAAAELGIRVAGLVDRDRTDPSLDGIVAWPVCMIENLLLDPVAIAHVATGVLPDDVNPTTVEAALFEQAQEERHDEIALRVTRELGAKTIRPKGASSEEVRNSLTAAIQDLQVAESRIEEAITGAETEVEMALANGTYVETFRGKALLRGIYRRLAVASHDLSFEQFTYAIAQRLAEQGSLAETIDTVFRSIEDPEAEDSTTEVQSLPRSGDLALG